MQLSYKYSYSMFFANVTSYSKKRSDIKALVNCFRR